MRKQENDRGLAASVGLTLMLGLLASSLRAQERPGAASVAQHRDQASETYGGGINSLGEKLLSANQVFEDGKARALVKALWRLDTEAARELVESGADINSRGRRGLTVLLFLIGHEQVEATQLALSLGADPNLATDLDTPLYYATKAERWEDLLKMLVDAGADIEKASELSRLGFCYPIEHRVLQRITLIFDRTSIEPLWWVLEHGGSADAQNCRGGTLLNAAFGARQFDVVYWLLERGANPHIRTREGRSFAEWLPTITLRPVDASEAAWMRKVDEKVKELVGNEEMIRRAREIDAEFAEFYGRYKKTRAGAYNERMKQEIGAISDALEEHVENASKKPHN